MAAGGPTPRLVGANEGVVSDAGGETGSVLEATDMAGWDLCVVVYGQVVKDRRTKPDQ